MTRQRTPCQRRDVHSPSGRGSGTDVCAMISVAEKSLFLLYSTGTALPEVPRAHLIHIQQGTKQSWPVNMPGIARPSTRLLRHLREWEGSAQSLVTLPRGCPRLRLLWSPVRDQGSTEAV